MRMLHWPCALRGICLAAGLGLGATVVSPPARAATDPTGFVYGKVTTESGSSYEGRIRWGAEEAFWGDHFNGTKEHRTLPEDMPERTRKRTPIKIFGITIGVRWDEQSQSRAFKAAFGDIREIHVRGSDSARVLMKSGSEYGIDGGSNDLGAKIAVWDPGIGKVDIEWDHVDSIEFSATPKRLDVDERRLHATVHTNQGEFRGFIQWDQDECLSSDKLDGDSRDAELSIEMGRIRTIERRSRDSSRVVLVDGREFVLDGSNDVDSDNRGIFVNDPRYGRVLVTWDAFERIEFDEVDRTGPAYDDFEPGDALRGTVTDTDGGKHRGVVVFDLDETETWELFDGNRRGIEYAIPFHMIRAVVPESGDSSRVVLRGGEEIELEDTADAGEGNAGVLVLENGREKVYLPWDEVRRIDFD